MCSWLERRLVCVWTVNYDQSQMLQVFDFNEVCSETKPLWFCGSAVKQDEVSPTDWHLSTVR